MFLVGYDISDYTYRVGFLFLSALSAGFGNSLESISVLAIMSTSFLIIGLDFLFRKDGINSWSI